MIVKDYNFELSHEEILTPLKDILSYAKKEFIPVLLEDTSLLLIDTLKKHKPKSILEIGTAIGYSGLIMLNAVQNVKLTTIELNKENYTIAKSNFTKYNMNANVNQILGDAYDEINKLAKSNQQFDFIFLDGPKGQYIKYLSILDKLLSKDGIIFADDVLFMSNIYGNGVVKHKHRAMITKLREYVKEVTTNKKYDTIIYNVGDGVAITKIKGETNE